MPTGIVLAMEVGAILEIGTPEAPQQTACAALAVDHVEVVAVDRVSLLDEAIKTGLQVQGVDRSIMLIGHYAHARIITRETSVLKVGIGNVITIIGGTAKHVFLEVPPAWAYGRIVYTLANWLAAIVKQIAAVVDLFDNGQIYKRKIEMARRGGLALGHEIGYLAIQRA